VDEEGRRGGIAEKIVHGVAVVTTVADVADLIRCKTRSRSVVVDGRLSRTVSDATATPASKDQSPQRGRGKCRVTARN